jgi:hypothetical protein
MMGGVMAMIAAIHLAVGGLLVVLLRRDKLWSSFGLLLVVIGFALAQLGTDVEGLQYAAWAIAPLSGLAVATAIPRRAWAEGRRELVLAGATMVGIWVTYVSKSLSKELLLISMTLTAASAAWLVVGLVVRARKLGREVPSPPAS